MTVQDMKSAPKLRFPEFTNDWEIKKLGDLIKYTKGYAFKSDSYRKSGVRIVRASDLGSSYIKQDNDKIYISNEEAANFERYSLKKGNIIVTTVGSRPEMTDSAVGRGIYVSKENEGLLNQNMLKIELSNIINTRFIFSYFNTNRYIEHIKAIKRGNANQANITVKDLLEYNVSCTSLEEQDKIADYLIEIDRKIEALQQKSRLVRKYKKGVVQAIFSRGIRFKQDNGDPYQIWQDFELDEVITKSSVKNRGSVHKLVQSISNTKGFVNQTELFNNRVIASKDLSNYYVISKGVFAYNPSRIDVGSLAYKSDDAVSVVSPLYVCFKAQNEKITDQFLLAWFESNNFIKQMNSSFEGSVRNTLSYESLKRIKIDVPVIEEQQKITSFLLTLDEKINIIESELELANNFKKAMLQRMFV